MRPYNNAIADGLIANAELRGMQEEARKILANPSKLYEYHDQNYRGGPRNVDPQTLIEAGVELISARLLVEELRDRVEEAEIVLLTLCQDQIEQGIPVDSIARHSGMKHRSSVYRALRALPARRARRRTARGLRDTIRKAGT